MARVLVVEDEESFSDALSYVLRKEGFEVAVSGTGTGALTEFDRNGADIVLLDLMLPEMSGTEVCRQLRQKSAVPIIMVTARDSEIDKVVGLEIGADDYVTKPYSPRELVARVRAVLRRNATEAVEASAQTLAAGPVRMDVERHVASVAGASVALPLKELQLLELLLRNAGRARTCTTSAGRVHPHPSRGGRTPPPRSAGSSSRRPAWSTPGRGGPAAASTRRACTPTGDGRRAEPARAGRSRPRPGSPGR